MASTELAHAYVQLIPSFKDAESILESELVPAAEKAGDKAGEESGKKSGKGFLSGWKGVATAAAAAAVGAVFVQGLESAMAQADTTSTLQARLNLTEDQAARAGEVAGSLYASNYGESMEGVGDAVDAVMSSIAGMSDASAADLESVTAAALNLEKGFGVGVGEAATTAGILIQNGLAKDGTEAMDLLTASMQQVPSELRGEILPIMDEYAKHFAALGIDGPEAMNMIVSASENGAIGMDKMGDAVKEFTIRATDMSKTTTDAYKSLGLNSDKMTADLLAGGDKAAGAMDTIVGALQNVKDPAEQSALALSLFGTPLEDLGTDSIPEFLAALNPAAGDLTSTAGAAQAFGDTLNSGPSNALGELKRSVESGFGSMMQTAMPAIEAVTGFLNENQWVVTAFTGLVLALAIAWGVYTVAQWAVNSALLASPITWIILAIVALVAGIVYLATQTEFFQTIWNAVWGAIKTAFNATVNWLKSAMTAIKNWWTTTWNAIKTTASNVWNAIKSAVSNAINGVKNTITTVVNAIKTAWSTAWNAVKTTVSNVWNSIKTAISNAMNSVKTTISNIVGAIKTVWSNGFNALKNTVSNIWSKISGTFRGGISTIGGIFKTMGDKIMSPFRSAFNSVAGFWNRTIGKISFKVPDWVPKIGGKGWTLPQIPMLAAGAVVTQPTLAMVGEAGPEAVFPLDQFNEYLNVDPSAASGMGLTREDLEYLADLLIGGLSGIAEGAGMASDLIGGARRRSRRG